jgi:methylglutaconyl-CoA hydratase
MKDAGSMNEETLPLNLDTTDVGGVRTLWLNRPELHNAFDEALIASLTAAVELAGSTATVRVLVLAGRGRSFCAGGDLNWMLRAAKHTPEQNLADARLLAKLFQTVSDCPKPVVARVHGNALAGGTGLAAACDLVVADTTARFGTTEVRIGLVPGTIAPYLVRAIGPRAASRYFLTGERFDAAEAHRLGLVHELCAPEELDAVVAKQAAALQAGGPESLREAKALLRHVTGRVIDTQLMDETAQWIARVRGTAEAQEGLTAFLAKRPPAWLT